MPNHSLPAGENDLAARHALVAGLLYRATTLATEAESLDQALEACITAVLERTGWHSGYVWRATPEEGLTHVGSWFNQGLSADDGVFCRGELQPQGRNVGDGADVAWTHLEPASGQLPRDAIRRPHMNTSLTVPVLGADGRVRFVFEFLHTERVPRTEDVVVFGRLVAEILTRVIERQEVAERLAQAKEAAEAANRAKSEFLAKMSHELRTPLNVMLGMIQLALQHDLPVEVADYLATARQAGHELLGGLNDLLEVSDLERLPADAVEIECSKRQTNRAAPLSILLAEDLPANQKLVTSLLRNYAHQVTIAQNGREAIECVLRGNFDLVLMDVRMPLLDGYEATKAIRAAEQQSGRHVPIIAMTAHAGDRDREACRQAGMDDYLSKPIDFDKLVRVIDRWTGKVAAPPLAAGPRPAASDARGGDAALNFPEAMRRLHGDRALFQEFVHVFDEDAPPLLRTLNDAMEAGDAAQLRRAAHSLRGLAVNLGADRVQRLAAALETQAERNDLASARSTLQSLLEAFEQLQVSLDEFR